jgi:hypothetical protein
MSKEAEEAAADLERLPRFTPDTGEDDGGYRSSGAPVHGGAGEGGRGRARGPAPGIAGAFPEGTREGPGARQLIRAAKAAQFDPASLEFRAAFREFMSDAAPRHGFAVFMRCFIEGPPEAPRHEGIVMGEVEAWRAWRVGVTARDGALLHSVYARRRWEPGGIMHAHDLSTEMGHGVHAFRDADEAYRFTAHTVLNDAWSDVAIRRFNLDGRFAIGRVRLWGEIIEFEKGFHAEHARVAGLDLFVGNIPLEAIDELQRKYNP